jgi:hypothetical protein
MSSEGLNGFARPSLQGRDEMSDRPDGLKAHLLAILNGGPPAVTADEAMARAKNGNALQVAAISRRLLGSPRRARLVGAIAFAAVVALLASFAITGHIGGSAAPGRGGHPSAGAGYVLPSVPASVFEKVGLPSEISNLPVKLLGTHAPLASHGLPELLYLWASYCPFCAAENWALALALSRFGNFKGLSTTNSSLTDFAPDTQTINFYRATYTSPYLVFNSYDLATNKPSGSSAKCNVNGYACLQTAPGWAFQLFQTVGGGSFPFMDFGNKLVEAGAGFENQPLMLQGLNIEQIAADLSEPNTQVARAEVGSANYLTAAICGMTGNTPSTICSTPVVMQAEVKERMHA